MHTVALSAIAARGDAANLDKGVDPGVLRGTGDDPVAFTYKDGVRAYTVTKPFEGVLRNLERRYRETDSA